MEVKPNILILPNKILARSFQYLPFLEISRCRLVCKRFREASNSLLNSSFNQLQISIDREIKVLRKQQHSETGFSQELKAKLSILLEILQSEYKILRAICWRYIRRGICHFFAWDILDQFYYILKSIAERKGCADMFLDYLFDLNRRFGEAFERFVARVRRRNIVGDIVEVLNCNVFVKSSTISYLEKDSCHITATFQLRALVLHWDTHLELKSVKPAEFLKDIYKLFIHMTFFQNRCYLRERMGKNCKTLDVPFKDQRFAGSVLFNFKHTCRPISHECNGASIQIDLSVQDPKLTSSQRNDSLLHMVTLPPKYELVLELSTEASTELAKERKFVHISSFSEGGGGTINVGHRTEYAPSSF